MTTRARDRVAVIGRANIDLTIRLQHLPSAGRTAFGSALNSTAGGKALNQAVAVGRLGGRPQLIANAGADQWGERLRTAVMDAGVDTEHFTLVDGASTAAAVIQVTPNGESYVSLALSPATELTATSISQALTQHLPDVIVAQLDLQPEAARAALQTVRPRLLIGNLLPHPDFDRQLLAELDVFVVNEHEAAAVLGAADIDAEDAAAELRQLGPDIVIVTAGAKGAFYHGRGTAGKIPAIPVTVVDTSGAGDAFLGAFALDFSGGQDVAKAARAGVHVASIAVQQHGALLLPGRVPAPEVALA
ncbi:PfkB family carbohydrate kinase [Winogradskya humida]|uniref:Ribokinase n=1 Tax=Winogradskya humida TaxID=113566 RepID=A0ABQ4A1P2_9ACTN|nr:PfkB family carbohydrate kinase [Actinoplanes humidus]GIE24775.1 ribokinase [Actinoplanes humidus]